MKKVFESTQREAKSAFGKFAIYVEKKLVNPRHIEVQIIATDDSSEVVHLCERECSIQRRFQKLVELSPSPVVDEETREKITSYAILAAKALGYSNAGTIEMLRDSESGNFYFMEMNSRLQVEHPVTEFVTGVDLVCTQIKVAQGENLPFHQRDIKINGCAIECRINAENPLLDFAPTVGKVEHLHLPGGPGVRIDSAIYEGAEIPPYYDSMIAKLIVWARSFDGARERGIAALEEFSVAGLDTTIPFHLAVLRNEKFARGEFDTSFIDTSGVREQIAQAASRVDQEDYYFLSALLLSRNQFSEPSAKGGTETTTRRSPTWLRQEKGERFVDAV